MNTTKIYIILGNNDKDMINYANDLHAQLKSDTNDIIKLTFPLVYERASGQAKLVTDIINMLNLNPDTIYIIVTMSETIISRLGHSIAYNYINMEDVQVILTDYENRIAQYDEQGFLCNWPFGYFEPDRL